MRFELTTSTLARLRSTPELRPRRDKPFEFRAGGYIRHLVNLASACEGKQNIRGIMSITTSPQELFQRLDELGIAHKTTHPGALFTVE